MSDAPAPPTSAAPSTDGAAKPGLSLVKDEANSLDVSAAGKALRNARKRRGAQKAKADREAADARAKPEIVKTAPEANGSPVAEIEAVETDKADRIERESWAAKVKGELDQAKQKIATFEKIAKDGHAENVKLRDQIEDLTSDAEHYKGLFDRLVAGLKAQGFEVDPIEIQLAERDRELNRYKRKGERETQSGREQQIQQLAGSIKGRVEALVSKYPELDPKKNKEAADYLRFRLTGDPQRFPLDTLERDLEAFARHLRAQMGARSAPAVQSEQRPPRPQSSTLAEAGPIATSSKPSKDGFRSDKDIKADFLRRKAARAAG